MDKSRTNGTPFPTWKYFIFKVNHDQSKILTNGNGFVLEEATPPRRGNDNMKPLLSWKPLEGDKKSKALSIDLSQVITGIILFCFSLKCLVNELDDE